ncbi:uncharacterized protein LOC129000995 [Macrosteles quadrilineatus]|uniref:uncharacterized protein LOC129000995 n=1 Tax=Macrosteles quadrilineatus TaxID=74068 RepID=UPI0023E283AC|nr:uncharacterized protein LOC129000995 [Macrosteles quadrilineatus]
MFQHVNKPGRLVQSLTCKEIRVSQSAAKYTPDILNTLSPQDVSDCFDLLGKDKLTEEQAHTLWQMILRVYGSADQIPEEKLRSLGWITKGIPPNNFFNMSFTDIDTVAAFGRYFELNLDQLAALRDAVMFQWTSKEMSDLSSFDLANLGHILCAFNVSDISRIHADAYRDAANELSLLKNCSTEIIRGLANLAMSPYAFGDPRKWTALQVSSIGCVIAGVAQVSSIPSEAFKGISPDIVNCLPSSFFQSMSTAQLKLLPATSGVAVNEDVLTSKQGAAIEEAISGPTSRNTATTSTIHSATLRPILTLMAGSTLNKLLANKLLATDTWFCIFCV